MTLDEIEKAIEDHYKFFAVTAPGVTPRETGELGALWAMFDRRVQDEG